MSDNHMLGDPHTNSLANCGEILLGAVHHSLCEEFTGL